MRVPAGMNTGKFFFNHLMTWLAMATDEEAGMEEIKFSPCFPEMGHSPDGETFLVKEGGHDVITILDPLRQAIRLRKVRTHNKKKNPKDTIQCTLCKMVFEEERKTIRAARDSIYCPNCACGWRGLRPMNAMDRAGWGDWIPSVLPPKTILACFVIWQGREIGYLGNEHLARIIEGYRRGGWRTDNPRPLPTSQQAKACMDELTARGKGDAGHGLSVGVPHILRKLRRGILV